MERTDLPALLHAHFGFQAARTPDLKALSHGRQKITFGELDRSSDRLARNLAAHGIGAESYVGVHIERSIDYVICILGILRANAAVVPLPPSFPDDRKRQIIAFAKPDLLIDSSHSPLDSATGAHALNIEALLAQEAPSITINAGTDTQSAFVLCSSGSTGAPKMIERSHASFFHRLEWTWREHPFTGDDVGCQKAHMITTHSLYELFEPLLCGAPVVIIGDKETRNLEQFWDLVRSQRVTRLLLVPSMLQASLDIPGFSVPATRTLVIMGEYLRKDLAARVVAAFPASTSIYSIYGSTEASSTLVCNVRDAISADADLPLGQPIAESITILVRGDDGEELPQGERGRLFIGGRALFTGYFNDPERTANALKSMPERDGVFFDTRDDVRQLPSGELYFVARADDTVKVRGFRVDLQEVERAIRKHDGVSNTAVMLAGGDGRDARLVGFYSPSSVSVAAIFDTLRAQLPDYMLPSALVGVDDFPRTPSAKIDRIRLLAEHTQSTAAAIDRSELSVTEQAVAGAWASVLEHDQFGPQSSFFEAGGTSLTAFSLIYRLRTEFGLDRDQLGVEALYQMPTMRGISDHIDTVRSHQGSGRQADSPLDVALKQGTGRDQEPLFLISSAGGTLGAYNKLVKALDTDRAIVGIRDPFLWERRAPSVSFDQWAGLYLDSIRERQPKGPYFIAAYSSAGAFAYEIACRLQEKGEEVALLALIDPLSIASRRRSQFGWWVMNSIPATMPRRMLVRIAGRLCGPVLPRIERYLGRYEESDRAVLDKSYDDHVRQTKSDKQFIILLSSLFELNTGLPFTLSEADFADAGPDDCLAVFQKKATAILPELEVDQLERIALQYQMQVSAHQAYQLRRYTGTVLLVEPQSSYAGMTGIQLRPFVSRLKAMVLPLAEPGQRENDISRYFASYRAHFLSIRDDRFIQELSRVLNAYL